MTDLGTLRQHQLLSRLLGLAREQAQALEAERLDHFLTLMDTRERVIADLIAVEKEPPPANVLPLPTILPAGSDPDVKAAMQGLIRSILAQDDANELLLREQMGALQSAIGRVAHGAAAGRGYAAVLAAARAAGGLDERA